jgi:hypothetical protein
MHWLVRGQEPPVALGLAPRCEPAGRLALAFLLVLMLAMMRQVPVVGALHQPAYALLWVIGIAQDYRLFNWIDRTNYSVVHRVSTQTVDGVPHPLEPTFLFPPSLRATLLQAYLHNVRWMYIPRQHRAALKRSILSRLAQRACRTHAIERPVAVWSTVQRIHPGNVALTQGREQLLMEFQCQAGQAVLCRSFLSQRHNRACKATPAP